MNEIAEAISTLSIVVACGALAITLAIFLTASSK